MYLPNNNYFKGYGFTFLGIAKVIAAFIPEYQWFTLLHKRRKSFW